MFKLKTKWVDRWAKKSDILDANLLKAVDNLENNLSAANLGGGLYKVRVATKNRGKSGGFRTLIVYKYNKIAVVVYGFAKNEKDNLTKEELSAFKALAKDILKQTNQQIKTAIKNGVFIPIKEH